MGVVVVDFLLVEEEDGVDLEEGVEGVTVAVEVGVEVDLVLQEVVVEVNK